MTRNDGDDGYMLSVDGIPLKYFSRMPARPYRKLARLKGIEFTPPLPLDDEGEVVGNTEPFQALLF